MWKYSPLTSREQALSASLTPPESQALSLSPSSLMFSSHLPASSLPLLLQLLLLLLGTHQPHQLLYACMMRLMGRPLLIVHHLLTSPGLARSPSPCVPSLVLVLEVVVVHLDDASELMIHTPKMITELSGRIRSRRIESNRIESSTVELL